MSDPIRATPTADELQDEAMIASRQDPWKALPYLAQRLADALAEVARLRGSYTSEEYHDLLSDVAAMRQRAEAAEAWLPHHEWRCGHRVGLACCYECFEAMQHELFIAQTAERTWREDHQRAIGIAQMLESKLAVAQQRQAWWLELDVLCRANGNVKREMELRRLLGLEDAK